MNRKKLARRTALAKQIKLRWDINRTFFGIDRFLFFFDAFDRVTEEFIKRADNGQHPWPGGRAIMDTITF